MAFSIWEYLRERARNATLAGIQDALDIAEDADFETSQKAAADRLTARLSGDDPKQLPEPENVTTSGQAAPVTTSPESTKTTGPPPSTNGRKFGDGLEAGPAPETTPDPFTERLHEPLPPPRGPTRNGRATEEPSPPPKSQTPPPRPRGRPRKDGT